METLAGLLRETFTSLPVLQVFAGAAMMIVIAYMVMRAQGDKAQGAGPAPPAASLHDVPAIFAQGPRETLDLLREIRDFARRGAEDAAHLADDVRAIRDDGRRRNEILDRIDREMAVANRRGGHA